MGWRILITEEFERDFGKLDNSIKKQISNEIDQLKSNPFRGKPLGYRFFREKKVQNHRVYYLIYKEKVIVFVIAVSSKKNQQEAIERIKHLIPYYKNEIDKNY